MSLRPAALLASLLLGLGLLAPAAFADEIPDPANPTAVLEIQKTAAPAEVGPGDSVTYTIQIGCSAISAAGCLGAITTDVVPAPLVIDSVVPSGPNDPAPGPYFTGQDVRVDWVEDLTNPPSGVIGMLDNTTSTITITAHVPEDVPYDYDGQTVTNNATAEATNATDATASADVTIDVPLDLDTSATKTLDPTSALAAAGTPVTADLGGSNDSNATVDTLVIQDPVDPTASPNPFTYLGFTGFGDVTPPEGATGTTYEVYVGGAWVTCADTQCSNVDPADVEGTRVTFTGAIPPGASASVDLDLETTDAAATVPADTTVTNDVQSEVDLDGDSDTADASADFTIQANDVSVAASKSFDPALVVAGDSSTATIGGTNTSPFPIDSMTITEPSTGSFPDEYTFGGFTSGITYPEGATSGTVTYQPSGETVSFADGEIPAPPSGGADSVTSFQIGFEGDIQPGAEASASAAFDVDTDAANPNLPDTVNNEISVEGDNDGVTDDATADDDLYIYDEVIEPYIDKEIRPSQIIGVPGQIATVTLHGGTTERPDPPDNPDGTTGNADEIVIQDPEDPFPNQDPFWNAFDLETITATPIPADAELTVEYYNTDTGQWETLDGPIQGPTVYSYDVPDDISEVAGGVRFDYVYTGTDDGFAPGTDLEPNFTVSLRGDGRYFQPPYNTDPTQPDSQIPNCAQTDASSITPGVPDGLTAIPPGQCPIIDIIPPDGEGAGDLIDKNFGTSSSGTPKSVIARSGDTIPSTLSWSTGGYSGFETVEITDVSDPTIPVAESVYDAFDLIRVDPITAAQDPYLQYDQVTSVELWDGSAWVDATNDPCPAACDGTFPGMDLTGAEQGSTLSVRLTFAESPTRTGPTADDPAAPPVGSGVARSIGNDRQVTLVWQVRDTKRSDGSPALAEDLYNLTDPGVVRNTVDATGYPETGDPVSDQAQDDVVITDVPITTTTDKQWLGGPLALPAPGTPAAEYPSSRIRVTTTNTTPARVDQLQITDPVPGPVADDPFEYFTLWRIVGIAEPEGTDDTTVTLTCAGGATTTYTRAEALALTEADLACVVGVEVLFDGRIASGGQGGIALNMRLRPTTRTDGDPVTVDDSPVANTAEGIVADVDAIQDCPPDQGDRYACDQGTDAIEITNPTFGVTAGKTITPASQKEGDDAPVTVTISAQNSGSARPTSDELTDDDPTFWNAMDLVSMDPSWTLPQPVEHVQACYLTGGAFTAANVAADAVGGDWTCQDIPGGGPPFDPGELTLDEARDFIDSAPVGDVHGLRFTFLASNDGGWQNPADPLIQVPFLVERRAELRSGGPVPTTRSDQSPAPGETDAGVFVDTVEVHGESVLIGPTTRLTDDDTADDDYTYEHLTVGVEVDKQPEGEVQPGTVIPFTLTYTNTGEAPLTDPVFTDVLPSDADGNQLIFDPDATPGSSPYGFELTGPTPTPPNGLPLPTDEDDITITESGDTITFAMPPGTVLEPGQTYTITIDLVLRPGLTPDDVVTNTDVISADEPFDPGSCSPSYGPDAEHTDDVYDGACWDDTDVSPVRVAAISTVKKVKADVPVNEPGIPEIYLDRDVLPPGTEIPDDYCDTAADADGFYRSPCVPMTYPGDTETWRFAITNSGTLPLDELVSIDVLPHVGDDGVIVDLPRDSEWTPTFADTLTLVDSTGTPIGDIGEAAYYSTSYDPCTDDLRPLGTPCPDGEWLPYIPGTTDPTIVKSIKTVLTFPDGEFFDPGDQVVMQARTTTTPSALADSTYPVAWNTAATGGVAVDGGTREQLLPTEGRKVGVTYPTGPIQLQKVVTGDGAAFAPDSFDVQLECTVDGEPMTDLPVVTLPTNGDPVQVDGLPWGAECTASESDQGQTSESADSATVGGPQDDIGLVTVTNVFEVGSMTVTKTVDSDAVDQDDTPIEYGPFEVDVECTFLGDEVFADGYDADNPMTFEIADGEEVQLDGLPIGAECTTTEPDSADAADVDIAPATVTIGGDDSDPADVQAVAVTNTYGDGSLHLRKRVAPEAVEQFPISQGPFTLHVTCTLTDASHPGGEVVYDDDVVLQGPQPLEATIDNIAAGAVCEVTEPDPGASTFQVIRPRTVTIRDDDTVNVVAINFFGDGALTVTKTVEGPGADRYGAGPFEVSLSCTYTNQAGEEVPLNTPGGATRELSEDNDYTATYEPLLFGSTCEIEETETGGATTSVITDADGNEVSEFTVDSLTEDLQIDVTNTFEVGSVQVKKQVIGPGPDSFEVELACEQDVDGDQTKVEIPGGATRTLSAGDDYTATYDELPTGAECTLVETDDGGAQQTTITPNSGDPEVGTLTVGDGTTVKLRVVNEFPEIGPGTDNGDGDGLPGTGAGPWLLWLLGIGVAFVGGGALLVTRSRRQA